MSPRVSALSTSASMASPDWHEVPLPDLIAHILERYHECHRQQLPQAIHLALKVEQAHGTHDHCPRGLADHLRGMRQELENHMRKEEQVLFPLIMQGRGALAGAPIAMMRMEHDEHADALASLRELTGGLALPEGACNTWRTLYMQLQEFEQDLTEHIRLENHVLFMRAAGGRPD